MAEDDELSLIEEPRRPLDTLVLIAPPQSAYTRSGRASSVRTESSFTSGYPLSFTSNTGRRNDFEGRFESRLPGPRTKLPRAQDIDRLIIAIDYGTTYTGIAYAALSTSAGSEQEPIVHVITDWGRGMTDNVKIPSIISYSSPLGSERQFGADISPDDIAMVNTKLELDVQENRAEELDLIIAALDGWKGLNFDHDGASQSMFEYAWKAPEDVVTTFLTRAFTSFREATAFISDVRSTASSDIVITVPVNWSYRARNATFKAIRNAGFNQSGLPLLSKYFMVSEPEAAATYTKTYMQSHDLLGLKLDQCFIVCDAGGGTVDVIGYRVAQDTPLLEFETMTLPASAKCGSSFINTSFKKWLRHKLGEEYKNLDPRHDSDDNNASTIETGPMRELIREFEAHKHAFSQNSSDMPIDLPESLTNLTIPNLVNKGELVITHEDMRSFFDPCVDQIIELIQGQVFQIEMKRRRVTAILLIGGFSESRYLQEELTKSIVGLRRIRLYRPDFSWSAVVQGAVLYGMELHKRTNIQEMIPCPRHYGLKLNSLVAEKKFDYSDQHTESNSLLWLIQKGDLLLADEERVLEQTLVGRFRENSNGILRVSIVENSNDEAPQHYYTAQDETTEVQVLTADFSRHPLEGLVKKQDPRTLLTYYEARLVCKITIKGMALVGEMWWYDQCMDKMTISSIGQITES